MARSTLLSFKCKGSVSSCTNLQKLETRTTLARDCDGAGPSNHKSMKKLSYDEGDVALLQWFNQK
jgi:hypothetical protein